MDAWLPTPPPPHVRVSVDSLDTLNIPGSSMDAWLPTPPRQSIRGFPGYSEHPWIIHGHLASYPPPPHVRVSVDSLDTLNIPGSSMDAWLPTPPPPPPMSEYPWIPWIL